MQVQSQRQPHGLTCASCQKSKVKCDGQRPCSRCQRRGTECVDGTAARRKRLRQQEWGAAAGQPAVVATSRSAATVGKQSLQHSLKHPPHSYEPVSSASSSSSSGSVSSAGSATDSAASRQAHLAGRMATLTAALPRPIDEPSETHLAFSAFGSQRPPSHASTSPSSAAELPPSVNSFQDSTADARQRRLSDESIQMVLARTHLALLSYQRTLAPSQAAASLSAGREFQQQQQNGTASAVLGEAHAHGGQAARERTSTASTSSDQGDLWHNYDALQLFLGHNTKARRIGGSADSVSSLTSAKPGVAAASVPGTAWLTALASGKQHELRFNAGAFMLEDGPERGVDPAQMAARIAALLAAAPEGDIVRMFKRDLRHGGLPLRLLQSVAPQLQSMLLQRAMLNAHSCPEGSSALHRIMFDGLHLSLPGLAAVLVAWHAHADVAVAPPSYFVVMAPSSVMHGTGTHSPARHSGASQHLNSIVNSGTAPMRFILDRWPHLPALFHAAPEHAVCEARAFLQSLTDVYAADAADLRFTACDPLSMKTMPLVPTVPRTLVALQREHSERSSVAAVSFVLGANCRAVQWVGYNSRLVELMGMEDWPIQQLIETPRPPGAPQPRWLHPSCLTRRALAYLAASNCGASSFQVEAQFVRCAPPPKVAGGAQTPAFTPHLEGWTASSFYAVETVHYERYHNGLPMARTSYVSDIIPVRGRMPLHELEHATAEAQLASIETMILSAPNVPLEVAMAVRRSGLPAPVALKASALDSENERILVRMFLLAAGGHGLLDGAKAVESDTSAAGSDTASSNSGSSAQQCSTSPGSESSEQDIGYTQPEAPREMDRRDLVERSVRAARLLALGTPLDKVKQNAEDLVQILSGKHDPDGFTVTVGSKLYRMPCVSAAAQAVMAGLLQSVAGLGGGFTYDQIATMELLSIPFA